MCTAGALALPMVVAAALLLASSDAAADAGAGRLRLLPSDSALEAPPVSALEAPPVSAMEARPDRALAVPGEASPEPSARAGRDTSIEAIDGTTFDDKGRAVGQSSLEIETTAEGEQHMRVELAVEGGGRNLSQAILVPVVEGAEAGAVVGTPSDQRKARMRIVEQRSQATTADGHAYPLLVIDHRRGRVSCYPANEDASAARHVDIQEDDRVVNVPMQLLFQPLVEGEVDTLRFQIALCTDGPVIHRMIATRAPIIERDGRRVVEIRYGPDFGKTVAWFASRLLPSFSFWFDADDGEYLGHRMPLHREGPEVLLVRRGLTPPDLGID